VSALEILLQSLPSTSLPWAAAAAASKSYARFCLKLATKYEQCSSSGGGYTALARRPVGTPFARPTSPLAALAMCVRD
jgi:hypothetical protein